MPTVAEIKIELKAKKIKGITGKNKAQLLAMLEASKSPANTPKPIASSPSLTKSLSDAMEHLIKEIHSEKKTPIVVRKATIANIVKEAFDGSEEPGDDMRLYDATGYIDKLITELKKPKSKFMSYGGHNYGGEGSSMEAIIYIVSKVLNVIDTKNIVDIELKEVFSDDYAFKSDNRFSEEKYDIEKYNKYVKARLPIDEEMGYSVPEFFNEYTTTIKPMEGTDKEKLFYKNNLIKNLEETRKQIIDYDFY